MTKPNDPTDRELIDLADRSHDEDVYRTMVQARS